MCRIYTSGLGQKDEERAGSANELQLLEYLRWKVYSLETSRNGRDLFLILLQGKIEDGRGGHFCPAFEDRPFA